MKKLFSFLLICLLLFLCGCEEKEYTHYIYKVNLSEKCISNNSVGNEWEIKYEYNGEIIENGDEIAFPIGKGQNVLVEVTIIERESCPDISRDYFELPLDDGTKSKCRIIVREDKGRYTGNTAEWEIECTTDLIRKAVLT